MDSINERQRKRERKFNDREKECRRERQQRIKDSGNYRQLMKKMIMVVFKGKAINQPLPAYLSIFLSKYLNQKNFKLN